MKNPMLMTRMEIITELSGMLRKGELEMRMCEPTAQLRARLAFLRSPKHEQHDFRERQQPMRGIRPTMIIIEEITMPVHKKRLWPFS